MGTFLQVYQPRHKLFTGKLCQGSVHGMQAMRSGSLAVKSHQRRLLGLSSVKLSLSIKRWAAGSFSVTSRTTSPYMEPVGRFIFILGSSNCDCTGPFLLSSMQSSNLCCHVTPLQKKNWPGYVDVNKDLTVRPLATCLYTVRHIQPSRSWAPDGALQSPVNTHILYVFYFIELDTTM